jgi:carboxyl-terminal processing protease
METNMKRNNKDNFVIGSITTILAVVIVLLVFSPKLVAQTKDDEADEQLLLFRNVMEFIQSHYVDEDKVATKTLIQGALKGMIESLGDPHSAYLSEDDMKEMEETTTGKFGGVGLYILKVDKGIEVARPIPGTPAFRAGVMAGDIIIAVEDKPTPDMKVDDVVKLLKGTPGTKVKITILRGESKTFDMSLAREMIELPTVKKAMIMNDIGYLQILQFTPLTYDRVKEAIDYFIEKKYKGLVVDVRSNPGGLLSSVIDIADLFLPPGTTIVSTKSRFPEEDRKYTAKNKPLVAKEIPIVVLIDKYSASAAEILTGALKDTGRAYVMGEKSYGKASVQQIQYIGDAGYRLTIARYYTPSGISIDKIGIKPDKAIAEDTLTKDEQEALWKIVEKGLIEDFVKKNKTPADKDIVDFIGSLKKSGLALRDKFVRKLIRNELNRTVNNPPEYDLEYDTVLQEAIWHFQSGDKAENVKK